MKKTPLEEARKTIARRTKHGTSKTSGKSSNVIVSVGSERNRRQSLANYYDWCIENNIHPNMRANISILSKYLLERCEWIQQKTLDLERQSLQLIYTQKLPYVRSLKESVFTKRSYTFAQIEAIASHQSEKHALTTWLAFFVGVRAHEPATLLPISERSASSHRIWDKRRFIGLHSYQLYTVCGKGGLVREVALPNWLSIKIEKRRLKNPIIVRDREVIYLSHYDIGHGQCWSQSFSSSSKKVLGFSRGGHGARHSYAKWRLSMLLKIFEQAHLRDSSLCAEEQSLLILSQELGHFRLDIVFCYMR